MLIKPSSFLGLPEGRIPLAQAVIYVARAPKSNEACMAIDTALSDISQGKDFPPPMHLRDAHYKDAKITALVLVMFTVMMHLITNSSLCRMNLSDANIHKNKMKNYL